MIFNESENKIKELTDKLNYYSKCYYTLDKPEISDAEYDKLYRELVDLEKTHDFQLPYSPTKRIGDEPLDYFKKVNHIIKMDSLQDAFSMDEVGRFFQDINKKISNPSFVLENKIDGLSVCLTYENGVFTKGATRGNGFVGEDVTSNLRTIKTLPLKIDTDVKFLQVRGEVFLNKQNFNKIVKEQLENGVTPFKNPRNAAAGSLRQKSSEIVYKRNLDIFIFNLQIVDGISFDKHSACLDWLQNIGFNVSSRYNGLTCFDEIEKHIIEIGENRNNFDYEIDGAVLKVDDLNAREILGSTDKVPKWAIAFKYPAEEKSTKIINIELNVGRSGSVTPTAVFEPIELNGSTVSRASLHNQDFIKFHGVDIGDVVSVRKSGDIIPEIVRVVEKHSSKGFYVFPKKCPFCQSSLLKDDEKAAIKCLNLECPSQILNKIIHFVSRECMNIQGLGESIIKTLVENNLIKKVEDLYKLKFDSLIDLDNFKEKSVTNLLNAINLSKNNKFENVLFSLGIDGVGKKSAHVLSNHFSNIENLKNASEEDILNIDGFGKITAHSIVKSFENKDLLETIENLKNEGLQFSSNISTNKESVFYGKNIVITGVFSNYKRSELDNILSGLGANVRSSVSGNTDYLICGQNAGSKLNKAIELNVDILKENDLENML